MLLVADYSFLLHKPLKVSQLLPHPSPTSGKATSKISPPRFYANHQQCAAFSSILNRS